MFKIIRDIINFGEVLEYGKFYRFTFTSLFNKFAKLDRYTYHNLVEKIKRDLFAKGVKVVYWDRKSPHKLVIVGECQTHSPTLLIILGVIALAIATLGIIVITKNIEEVKPLAYAGFTTIVIVCIVIGFIYFTKFMKG